MFKTIIFGLAMWQDILNIDPACQEDFFDFQSLPGNGKSFIACAGVSHLLGRYQIGKTGVGEDFGNKNNDKVHVHYLISTHSGAGKLTLEGGTYDIRPGMLMLLPAGTPFLYEIDHSLMGDSSIEDEPSHWDMCWLLLHDCPEYEFVRHMQPGVWSSEHAPLLYQTMSLIRNFDHTEGHYSSDILLRLIEVLLYQIEQSLNHAPGQSELQTRFYTLMRSVNKQLQLPWSVALMAKKMHLSEPHFYRLCKKETGKTPMKLLTQTRMDYACYLLRYTNYNLEQISETVGYGEAASFAHRFKRDFGQSPGQWRGQESRHRGE